MHEKLGLHLLRIKKLAYSLAQPACWRPLRFGVAPSLEHRAVLRRLAPDLLLDVGANRGQFSLQARLLMPTLPIHAYEPLRTEAAVFRAVHGCRKDVWLHEVALGATEERATIHISKSADSSSLLPIGTEQTALFPDTGEVGRELIDMTTLDALADHWHGARNALLKIDVQGFELKVLIGARQALKHCRYVYAECSSIPLYTGQALFTEVRAFLQGEGFMLTDTVNEYRLEGQLIQADYLFRRS